MTDEALVLCLYAGGTIGMVQKDAASGFAPYPSFLTETLRSQSRFHDPDADSIFSWSDSVERYEAWSALNTTTGSSSVSGHASPQKKGEDALSPTITAPSLLAIAAERASQSHDHVPAGERVSSDIPQASKNSTQTRATPLPGPNGSQGLPAYGDPVLVKSSAPHGTSTLQATSATVCDDGKHLALQLPTLLTPRMADGRRVRYAVLEYDPLLDSSEMDLDDWLRIAKDIQLNYEKFDAFVVLHGTDTMAYTSSALSMLLEALGKLVIVTGAQVPLSQLRNDAIENVLGALCLAGSYSTIPEVCLYFASILYRGNRVSKTSNNSLAAFESPNLAPLARVGIHVDINWNIVERARDVSSFRAFGSMCPDVAVLRLFPGLQTRTVESFLSPPLKGVILESYGAGNAPSRADLLRVFETASRRGLVIVNITQCLQGEVSAIYATGKKLEQVGVVPGADMTPECALAKLSYLLAKPNLRPEQVRELMKKSLRGELTERQQPSRQVASSPAAAINSDGTGSGHELTDIELLLAHILETSEGEESTRSYDVHATSSTEVPNPPRSLQEHSKLEIARASFKMLPYLIHAAASRDDAKMLQWHLDALAHLQEHLQAPSRLENRQDLGAPEQSSSMQRTSSLSLLSSTTNSRYEGVSRESTLREATWRDKASSAPLEASRPLHAAAALGHLSSISVLLHAGASVHLRDSAGHSPLFLAARAGHIEAVVLLKQAGAHFKRDEKELCDWYISRGRGDGRWSAVWKQAMSDKA